MNVTEIQFLRDQVQAGAQFYVSHSGGKDSQAMNIMLEELVPHQQLTIVHADLGEVEWDGVLSHIRRFSHHQVNVVRAVDKTGQAKDLLPMIVGRSVSRPDAPAWPSSTIRYCTSDLKRTPIEKFIRGHMKQHGITLAVNCMGLRAEESTARAKRQAVTPNKRLSKAGRTVTDFLPIHDWPVSQVFACIQRAGQTPHPAYALGNDRLSCVFCIFGSPGDLANGMHQRPELYEKYLAIEEATGRTMFNGESLADRVAKADGEKS